MKSLRSLDNISKVTIFLDCFMCSIEVFSLRMNERRSSRFARSGCELLVVWLFNYSSSIQLRLSLIVKSRQTEPDFKTDITCQVSRRCRCSKRHEQTCFCLAASRSLAWRRQSIKTFGANCVWHSQHVSVRRAHRRPNVDWIAAQRGQSVCRQEVLDGVTICCLLSMYVRRCAPYSASARAPISFR